MWRSILLLIVDSKNKIYIYYTRVSIVHDRMENTCSNNRSCDRCALSAAVATERAWYNRTTGYMSYPQSTDSTTFCRPAELHLPIGAPPTTSISNPNLPCPSRFGSSRVSDDEIDSPRTVCSLKRHAPLASLPRTSLGWIFVFWYFCMPVVYFLVLKYTWYQYTKNRKFNFTIEFLFYFLSYFGKRDATPDNTRRDARRHSTPCLRFGGQKQWSTRASVFLRFTGMFTELK